MSDLAIFGGPKTVKGDHAELFTWPIVTKEIEDAVLDVLRRGAMSGGDVTRQFEKEYAAWHGMKFGLGCSSGTAALQSAMYGCGVGRGDEIISPSVTYWASCIQAFSLGATIVFAEIDPKTLCVDPKDIEHRITKKTKAIVVVHYCGMPCDMDAIMKIARRHKVKVVEDCSHAHGALYKGRIVGSIGDVAGFSLMSGKSFACGEAGILLTNNREIYEKALVFGHYERGGELTIKGIAEAGGLPWGGYKYRMHQMSSAMGRVQIRNYPKQMAEIDKAMNCFCDHLDKIPGLSPHRTPKGGRTTMGGWYSPVCLYDPAKFAGLSVGRFCEALRAEGVTAWPGCNRALHLHPLLNTVDVYGDGKPTRIANSKRDLRQKPGTLPVSEGIQERVFSIPWFKKYSQKAIAEYAAAFAKVARNYKELLEGDTGKSAAAGGYALTRRSGA